MSLVQIPQTESEILANYQYILTLIFKVKGKFQFAMILLTSRYVESSKT